ncbi:precorrin-6Y C5,15-methyltransferase (decarboxylating) subunit CbiT [Clostridium malenominatum]|uniref:precorrin-6Y C5,15-methyltransferase (decarboxylating) subunit CbiT n=1 Tax=Clostridium malenominatum TaxID=1539 RepID=UPI0031D50C82
MIAVENEEFAPEEDKLTFISDEEFIRGNCPMTKEEIRILSVAKMNLSKDSRVLDVGAGTGSISIQAAKICSLGEVVALEKDSDALEVIYKNIEKFNAHNLKVIEGEALEAEITGTFNSIFIGGSGGNLEDLIKKYCSMLTEDGKVVLNFITINNLYVAMNTLMELGYKVKCTQVSVSKTKGQTYMLMGNNPIFIIEGERKHG